MKHIIYIHKHSTCKKKKKKKKKKMMALYMHRLVCLSRIRISVCSVNSVIHQKLVLIIIVNYVSSLLMIVANVFYILDKVRN